MRKRILLLLAVACACSGEEANETRLLVSQVDRYAQMKNSSLADRVALVREMRAQEPTSPRVRAVRDVCVAAYDEVHRAEQSLTRAQQMFEPYRAAQKAPPTP